MSNPDDNVGIYVADADGSNTTRLTQSWGSYPSWSPDGTRIAFWSSRSSASGYGGDIYVMHAYGSNTTRLTQHDVWDDLWSPRRGLPAEQNCLLVRPQQCP